MVLYILPCFIYTHIFGNSILKSLDMLEHMEESEPLLAVFGILGEDNPLRGHTSIVAHR